MTGATVEGCALWLIDSLHAPLRLAPCRAWCRGRPCPRGSAQATPQMVRVCGLPTPCWAANLPLLTRTGSCPRPRPPAPQGKATWCITGAAGPPCTTARPGIAQAPRCALRAVTQRIPQRRSRRSQSAAPSTKITSRLGPSTAGREWQGRCEWDGSTTHCARGSEPNIARPHPLPCCSDKAPYAGEAGSYCGDGVYGFAVEVPIQPWVAVWFVVTAANPSAPPPPLKFRASVVLQSKQAGAAAAQPRPGRAPVRLPRLPAPARAAPK